MNNLPNELIIQILDYCVENNSFEWKGKRFSICYKNEKLYLMKHILGEDINSMCRFGSGFNNETVWGREKYCELNKKKIVEKILNDFIKADE